MHGTGIGLLICIGSFLTFILSFAHSPEEMMKVKNGHDSRNARCK